MIPKYLQGKMAIQICEKMKDRMFKESLRDAVSK